METSNFFKVSISPSSVLILPMRNGNAKEYKFPFREKLGSYPTYEEWKHATFLAIASFSAFVLILPMRNGNNSSSDLFSPMSSFLSYLWGMETLNSNTTSYWLKDKVLILPMRNGNLSLQNILLALHHPVLILPMRNGNNSGMDKQFRQLRSSYPTYEEWKPLKDSISVLKHISSYPTYEEWKLYVLFCVQILQKSSYPTYEEWKLKCDIVIFLTMYKVLILPMRNGNAVDNGYGETKRTVLILPMRNGNKSLILIKPRSYIVTFLSYLWGMET